MPDADTPRTWPAEAVRAYLDQCYADLRKDGFIPIMVISVEFVTDGKKLRFDAIPTIRHSTLVEIRDFLQECVERGEGEKDG